MEKIDPKDEEQIKAYNQSVDVVARVTAVVAAVAFFGLAALLGYKNEQKDQTKPKTTLIDQNPVALPTAKPTGKEQGKLILDRKGILLDNGPTISRIATKIREKDGKAQNMNRKIPPPNRIGK
jgi:preprotein translocase subunit SecG